MLNYESLQDLVVINHRDVIEDFHEKDRQVDWQMALEEVVAVVVVRIIMVDHWRARMLSMMNRCYFPNVNAYVNANEYEHDYVFHWSCLVLMMVMEE